MTIRLIAAIALVAAVLLPGSALAHEGHAHNALGTVATVQGNHVEVKTTDGKTLMVMLDAKTTVTRGKEKLDATAITVGERVSVDYVQEKDMLMARAFKLSTATAKK